MGGPVGKKKKTYLREGVRGERVITAKRLLNTKDKHGLLKERSMGGVKKGGRGGGEKEIRRTEVTSLPVEPKPKRESQFTEGMRKISLLGRAYKRGRLEGESVNGKVAAEFVQRERNL